MPPADADRRVASEAPSDAAVHGKAKKPLQRLSLWGAHTRDGTTGFLAPPSTNPAAEINLVRVPRTEITIIKGETKESTAIKKTGVIENHDRESHPRCRNRKRQVPIEYRTTWVPSEIRPVKVPGREKSRVADTALLFIRARKRKPAAPYRFRSEPSASSEGA